MNKEKTLTIIKPDAFSNNIIGEIVIHIEESGLQIVALKMFWIDKDIASALYFEHKNECFYHELVDFITSNPVILMVLEGNGAISKMRRIIGATDPKKAEAGTIRKKWGKKIRYNVIHGSSSPAAAKKEIKLFFSDSKQIFIWNKKKYI